MSYKKIMAVLLSMSMLAAAPMTTLAESSTGTVNEQQGEKPDGEPPEKPDGEQGDVPDKPDGEMGDAPEKPDGEGGGMGGPGGAPGEGGGMGGGSSAPESYEAVTTFSEDTEEDGGTYTSTGTDENAILVTDGASVSLSNALVTRDSEDSEGGDNSSFYGVGASILNIDGTAVISDSSISSTANGAAGVFSYGDGVTYVSDTTINTTGNTAGGIHVAGGGILYAWDLDVTTNGTSSAAIRSDRGSGTMVVDGGTYTSNGSDSPAVYCTADIAINDATLTANGSEGVCIEGLNSLHIYDSDLTSSMTEDERNEVVWNIIVYQSMSGDSEEGNGTFSMIGGSITAEDGGIFYTTNTESTFYLSGVEINYPEETDFFLRATGNSNQRGWGSEGANGADTTFTADAQAMEGDIITDSISSLDFYMENGSTLLGAFVRTENNTEGDGTTNVYISADSTWTVTGDSVVDALYNEGTIIDEDGNAVTIVDTEGNVLAEGTSAYTITVSAYEETADFSGASVGDTFGDHEVEQM